MTLRRGPTASSAALSSGRATRAFGSISASAFAAGSAARRPARARPPSPRARRRRRRAAAASRQRRLGALRIAARPSRAALNSSTLRRLSFFGSRAGPTRTLRIVTVAVVVRPRALRRRRRRRLRGRRRRRDPGGASSETGAAVAGGGGARRTGSRRLRAPRARTTAEQPHAPPPRPWTPPRDPRPHRTEAGRVSSASTPRGTSRSSRRRDDGALFLGRLL